MGPVQGWLLQLTTFQVSGTLVEIFLHNPHTGKFTYIFIIYFNSL